MINSSRIGVKILYFIYITTLAILIFFTTKKELHLTVNTYNNYFFDAFFKYITYLGDGALFGVLFVLFFALRKRIIALTFAISGILTLLITHFFKRIIFKGTPRPIEYFKEESLHLVEGVKMAHWHSFPSGHTTAAFVIATVLIFKIENKTLQILFLSLAILVGFSRVYLSQHFFEDVLAGSVLGVLLGALAIKVTNLVLKNKKWS